MVATVGRHPRRFPPWSEEWARELRVRIHFCIDKGNLTEAHRHAFENECLRRGLV